MTRDSTKTEDKQVAINIRTIPDTLRQRFKIWCVGQKVSMQDAVVALIELAVSGGVTVDAKDKDAHTAA